MEKMDAKKISIIVIIVKPFVACNPLGADH